MDSVDYQVAGGGCLQGTLIPPGDKSISHRASLLAALAHGETQIDNFLAAEDCLATLGALRALGVQIKILGSGSYLIKGAGAENFQAPADALYLGNSGTGLRLLAGILAACPFASVLGGDESLCNRPMERIIVPLRRMGAKISSSQGGRAPLVFAPAARLQGIHFKMPIASAQLKSCLLLAGLAAEGKTCVEEPQRSRDHTERMLDYFGCPVQRVGPQLSVEGGTPLTAQPLKIPGDLSSAMFAIVGACIGKSSQIRICEVGLNPTRSGGLDILRAMGADFEILAQKELCGEPVGDLLIQGGASLHGIEIPVEWVVRAIDEFPVLFIAAACAEGETVLRNASELRVKESDRLAVMAKGLRSLGVELELFSDGIRIVGREHLQGGKINSHGDHRIAMAFAIAALRSQGTLHIQNCANVNTSWPGFLSSMQALGLKIAQRRT